MNSYLNHNGVAPEKYFEWRIGQKIRPGGKNPGLVKMAARGSLGFARLGAGYSIIYIINYYNRL